MQKRLMVAGCFIIAITGQVVAAGAGVAVTAAKNTEKEPDVFSGDFMLAILTLAVFVLLLVALGKWAWKPLLASLQKREDFIRQSLQEAQQAREEAEKALAEYKAQLEAAQKESAEIIKRGREEAVALAEKLKQKAQLEARQTKARALRDINSAKIEALREIADKILDISTDIAGQIIDKTLDPKDHRELVEQTLSKIESQDIANGI